MLNVMRVFILGSPDIVLFVRMNGFLGFVVSRRLSVPTVNIEFMFLYLI